MLELGGEREWQPPVVRAVATEGEGLHAVWDAVCDHRAHQERSGGLAARRRARLGDEVRAIVGARLAARVDARTREQAFDSLLDDVVARTIDPYAAATRLMADVPGAVGGGPPP
jgi:LAO/AO transport system kinase